MTVSGIDVSAYQSSDFSTAGLGFVMVKATEGTGYVNPRHAAQVAHARAAGLVVGHYHFARPGSVSAQAAYFLRHADPHPGDLLAYDWEDTGVPGGDKDAWIKRVRAAAPGHPVLLYCNRDFWLHRDTTSYCGDGLWIADPDAPAGHPRVEHPYTIHQYSFAGGIDRNVARFADPGALRAWAADTTPTLHQEDDDMPTAQDVWNADVIPAARVPYANADIKQNPTWQAKYALQTGVETGRQTLALVKSLTAQVAALTAAVGALAQGGGITAEQIKAAAEAGADAALEKLGDALQPPAPASA